MDNLCSLSKASLSGCIGVGCHEKQRTCFFYKKASSEARCMYLIFDEFCWSTEAQDHRDGKLKILDEEDLSSFFESN